MKSASPVHVRQQVLEELKVAFAVKDDHRNAMGLIRRTNNACEILRNDVAQQRCFAGAGHAQHDRLHDAHPVRPIPGLTVNVIAENNRILIPGSLSDSFVTLSGDGKGRVGPLFLPPRSPRDPKEWSLPQREDRNNKVGGKLCQLAAREIGTARVATYQANQHDRHQNQGH